MFYHGSCKQGKTEMIMLSWGKKNNFNKRERIEDGEGKEVEKEKEEEEK